MSILFVAWLFGARGAGWAFFWSLLFGEIVFWIWFVGWIFGAWE